MRVREREREREREGPMEVGLKHCISAVQSPRLFSLSFRLHVSLPVSPFPLSLLSLPLSLSPSFFLCLGDHTGRAGREREMQKKRRVHQRSGSDVDVSKFGIYSNTI